MHIYSVLTKRDWTENTHQRLSKDSRLNLHDVQRDAACGHEN